ncbi:MAG: hypothetical protein EXQ53_08555 [Acidobacteria bacterium]|nr:hypothetical protein [Acidobacteriota bacterium]
MRLMPLMSSALVLAMSGTSFAQPPSPQAPASLAAAERGGGEWGEFASREDRFTITFPGQPKVTEATWTSQFSAILPARIYSGTQGSGRYSVTVVDYNPIERLLTERSRSLPALDLAVHAYGPGYWKTDVRSAVVYAMSKFLERDATITSVLPNFSDLVAGLLVQLTNKADQSRTFASIYMHENRLVIAEATVPKGSPPPLIFQQSIGWLDEDGTTKLRYQFIYYNDPDAPKPPLQGR